MTWQRNSLSGKTGKMFAETANEKPFSRDKCIESQPGISSLVCSRFRQEQRLLAAANEA
jgi:hypothetical protein